MVWESQCCEQSHGSMLTYSHQCQTWVFPELWYPCDRVKLPGSLGSDFPPFFFFFFPSVGQGFFCILRPLLTTCFVQGGSSAGWWMFIASERVLWALRFKPCCFLFGDWRCPEARFRRHRLWSSSWTCGVFVIYVPCVMFGTTHPTFLITV